jgi:hypothetical protein
VTLVLGGNGVQAKELGRGETPVSQHPAPLDQPDCIN